MTVAEPTPKTHNPLKRLSHALKSTSIAQKLSPNHSDSESIPNGHGDSQGEGDGSGKAHERAAQHRHEKELKREAAHRHEKELNTRRREEDEAARREESPDVRARYGEIVGDGELPQGLSLELPEMIPMEEVASMKAGQHVSFRARIHTQRKVSSSLDFILFRDQTHLLQGVIHRDEASEHMIKWIYRLHPESIVLVSGILASPNQPIKSATISHLEICVHSIHLISEGYHLPFDLYHSNNETAHNRLTHRIVDLRHPSNQAIFRIRAKIMQLWRRNLEDKGFIEINTPKLQPAATETGAEVFKVGYFGRTAFLAQSPQLAKQMAISADFKRVFEIGPVFRAENSNTNRHLTEYTGLDLEMAIDYDYHEVLYILIEFFKSVFSTIQSMKEELAAVRERFESEDITWLEDTPIIPFPEGIQMLRDDGRDVEMEDLSTKDEIRLGELVKEKYKTDFYVLDKFPKSARPFYTKTDGELTNSFDMFVRGQEVGTGGQRIHDAAKLRQAMEDHGMEEQGMEEYLAAFDWGVGPHAGAGLGLERIVMLLLNLGNVRFASLFHRDPRSLPAKKPSLPHPKSSTLLHHDTPPPLEELIANYGDASNTSWLDDRFELWHHPTSGATVGYVRRNKFVMITGDPLCDRSQLEEVISAFLTFVHHELKLKPMWMLVSDEVQEILGRRHKWRTFTCVEEQRIQEAAAPSPDPQLARRVERKGVEISEVQATDEVRAKVDPRIEEWKSQRSDRGKQVHMTEVAPWRDSSHRKYFIAETKDGHVDAMVVLARLAPQNGWQVKWALDFPNSTNGAIEVLITRALESVAPSPITFGVAVSEELVPAHHIRGARAKVLSRSYATIVSSLKLNTKGEFREKFGVKGDSVYLCYPKGALGMGDLKEIVGFFED